MLNAMRYAEKAAQERGDQSADPISADRPAPPARLQPRRVKYKVRNATTNAPNLFRKVPKKSIHAARGSARTPARNVEGLVFTGNKKPCAPFGKQGGKNRLSLG